MKSDSDKAIEMRTQVEKTVISYYRNSCRALHYDPNNAIAKSNKKWAEECMLSSQFKYFSALNGRKLLELLQEEEEVIYGKS